MNIVYIVIALLVVAVCVLVVMILKHKQNEVVLRERLVVAEEANRQAEAQALEARGQQENLREEYQRERMARVKAETQLESERQALNDKLRMQEDMEKMMREQFRTLAGDVLGEQSRKFKDENRESMDVILKPFKDNIVEFRRRVEDIYSHQTEQSGALKNELQRLMELNVKITAETTNLTNALKGNSKVQGDWGEMILETILENSKLIRGVHYFTQHNLKDAEGNNLRPDVVLNLPNNRQIIIDSKVNIKDYVRSVEAESVDERSAAMTAHIAAMRQHVKELSGKNYQHLIASKSPDFVIMFVPNEPAFLDALKEDNTIWSDAYKKKVIISSPTNMFALLMIVNDLWQREEQTKNQAEILKTALTMYRQVVDFTTALEGVGSELAQAQGKYDEAYKRLKTGNNNIVRLGERLRKLSGKSEPKRMSKALLEDYDGVDEDEVMVELSDNNKLSSNE
ncbi:MAG: DNA recombination protein RmuC [Alistipes sp.]|nr:DNA recombination protein RmuC [Alistipes sp.]